jgi:hypothetical protein
MRRAGAASALPMLAAIEPVTAPPTSSLRENFAIMLP